MDTQHAYLVRTQYLPVALAKAYAKQCNLPNDSDDVRVYRSNWGRQIKLLIDNKTIVEKDSHGLPLMDCPPLTGFIDLHDICAYGEANRIPSIPPAAVILAEAMEFIEPGEVLPQVAPAEPMPKAAPVDRGWLMKKAALIEKHAEVWPTIKRDFQDASENGLSKAAKAPVHGGWYEAAALNWADQRGKRTSGKQQGSVNSIFNLKGERHTIAD